MSAPRVATSWLWPDHAIGKRHSRVLREEHNALVNDHAALLEACKNALLWHQSDQWREAKDAKLREQWANQRDLLVSVIAKAEGKP